VACPCANCKASGKIVSGKGDGADCRLRHRSRRLSFHVERQSPFCGARIFAFTLPDRYILKRPNGLKPALQDSLRAGDTVKMGWTTICVQRNPDFHKT